VLRDRLPSTAAMRFLRALASSLRDSGQLGPGALHRAIVAIQRRYFDPPDL